MSRHRDIPETPYYATHDANMPQLCHDKRKQGVFQRAAKCHNNILLRGSLGHLSCVSVRPSSCCLSWRMATASTVLKKRIEIEKLHIFQHMWQGPKWKHQTLNVDKIVEESDSSSPIAGTHSWLHTSCSCCLSTKLASHQAFFKTKSCKHRNKQPFVIPVALPFTTGSPFLRWPCHVSCLFWLTLAQGHGKKQQKRSQFAFSSSCSFWPILCTFQLQEARKRGQSVQRQNKRNMAEVLGSIRRLLLASVVLIPCAMLPGAKLRFSECVQVYMTKKHLQPLLLAVLARAPCAGTWKNSVIHGKSPNLDSFWGLILNRKFTGWSPCFQFCCKGVEDSMLFIMEDTSGATSQSSHICYSERGPGLSSEGEGKGQRLSTAPAP